MKFGLSARFSLLIVGLTVVVVVVLSGALLTQFRALMGDIRQSNTRAVSAALLNQAEDQGKGMAQLLAESLSNPLYHFDVDAIAAIAQAAKKQRGVRYVYVFDRSARVVHDGTLLIEAFNRVLTAAEVKRSLGKGEAITWIEGGTLHVSAPVKIGSRILGGVNLGLSLAALDANIANISLELVAISEKGSTDHLNATVILAALLTLFAAVLSVILGHQLSKPIESLAFAARQIGRGDYNVGVAVNRSDEIGDLSNTIREMAQNLSETTVSKAYVDNILRNMADPLIVTASDGTIETVNEATSELLGYAPEELLGQPLQKLLIATAPPDPGPSGTDPHPESEGPDEWLIAKDGRQIPVLVARSPLEEVVAGKEARTVLVARDITERRQLEEQARGLQRLEALQRLTGGVAHEFNNLMQAIIGSLDFLSPESVVSERETKMLELAKRNALRGKELTARLMSYVGQQPFRPLVTDLRAFLGARKAQMETALGEMATFDVRLTGELWPIAVDHDQLEAALINLATNAKEAMPNGGAFVIEGENVHVDEKFAAKRPYAITLGDYVKMSVTDTGTGMLPEVQERAFDPFFTTKDVGEGMGLGLSMVFGFVRRQCGGFIEIDSRSGRGTSVIMYFPRSEGAG